MKKLLGVVAIFLVLPLFSCATKTHWAGEYSGVIYSADGGQINVMITLNPNDTYTLEYQNFDNSDEDFTRAGRFTWNSVRDTIIIDDEMGDTPTYYKLGDKALVHLLTQGSIISGEPVSDYLLYKQQ